MRKLLIILVFIATAGMTNAQSKSIDLGVGVGGSFYWGDMHDVDAGKSIKPVFSGLVRYNFNPRYSVRLNAAVGNIAGEGSFEDIAGLWSFDKSFWEIETLFEFNFLEYFVGNDEYPFTPYIMGGVGFMGTSYDGTKASAIGIPVENYNLTGNFTTMTIPFGLGVSFYLFPKFSMGAEAIFRKTMDDGFDDLDNPHGFDANDMWHNNDWVNYVGITLNYKLYSPKRSCHAYD